MNQVKPSEKTGDNRVSSTDPDASFMHHKSGSMPDYNAELSVTEDQLIVYSDVTTEPVDKSISAGIRRHKGNLRK